MNTISTDRLLADWLTHSVGDDIGIVTVCATRRLAAALARAHAGQRTQAGDAVWPAPPCLSWSGWLQQQYETLALWQAGEGEVPARLLSDAEARTLWLRIIAQARRDQPLLQPELTARLAQEAWRLAHAGGLALPLRDAADPDARAFNSWSGQYARRLEALHAWDGAQLPLRLADAYASGALSAPRTLVLAGFDSLNAAQQQLVTAITDAGTDVRWLDPPHCTAHAGRRAAVDPAEELRIAARQVHQWSRARPEARIGIVVPALADRRAALLRAFDAELCPDRRSDGPRPYNISLGLPLAGQALVADALAWLDWAAGRPLPLDGVAQRLFSGWWHGRHALGDAVRLDADWRRRRYEALTLPAAAVLARPRDPADADGGRARIAAALAGLRLPGGAHLPSEWSRHLSQALAAIGWPDTGALGSEDYQAWQAWQQQLLAFGGLDPLLGPLPVHEALRILRSQLGDTLFQPESADTPIQVLGALEASGLAFDHLLLLGLDEASWPPPPAPNPFLPLALQRAARLPGADARIQLEHARRLTDRLLVAAPEIVISHAGQIDDQARLPSPLIAALPERAPPAPGHDHHRQMLASAALETLDDGQGPGQVPDRPVAGGTQRLADQAACPFRGYARHALGAAAPESPQPPLDHRERGLLAHDALARLWQALGGQSALLALDAAGGQALISRHVGLALDAFAARAPHRLSPIARRLEAARLQRLIAELLGHEAARPPFRVQLIEGRSLETTAADDTDGIRAFAGLLWRTRPDRIDHCDGDTLIIDYKTGRATSLGGQRLLAPQLPFYALAETDCAGVAYALLRPGEVGFAGLRADDAKTLPAGLRPVGKASSLDAELREAGWAGLTQHWRHGLEQLAGEVRAGLATVTPWSAQSCANCDLHALCRIHEHDGAPA